MKQTSVEIVRLHTSKQLDGKTRLTANGCAELYQDSVVVEEPLHVLLKSYTDKLGLISTLVMTTMRTPGNDAELVTGWLNTQSFISFEDIENIDNAHRLKDRYVAEEKHHPKPNIDTSTLLDTSTPQNLVVIRATRNYRLDESKLTRLSAITSSCGICGDTEIENLSDNSRVSPLQSLQLNFTDLLAMSQAAKKNASLFCATGGSHAAAFFAIKNNQFDTKLLALREDVGRHNALDKLIGAHNIKQMQQFALLLSGRVSADLMQKVMCAGIPVVVSIGAPSSLAIELAESVGVILIGFVKESSCNIYAGKQQLNLLPSVSAPD